MDPRCRNCNSPYSVKIPEGKRRSSNSSTHKLPLLLQCGHVYCLLCLHKLSSLHSTDLPCPECRYPTSFTKGVDLIKQFPVCYYTLGLTVANILGLKNVTPFSTVTNGRSRHLDSKWAETDDLECSIESVTLCEECDQSRAEYMCKKCDCKLCNKCFDQIHSISKVLKTHSKISIESSGQEMSKERSSQLAAAMRTAQKHQHSLALARNSLCVARQKLLDSQNKINNGEELIRICQTRICEVNRSFFLEIDKQEIKLDDFDFELTKEEDEKRKAVKKCHMILQTNQYNGDIDYLLHLLTKPVDFDTLPAVHIPRIIINRDVLQESLEDSYHLSSESLSSVSSTSKEVSGQEKEEEEEEEEEDAVNTTASSFSLSPLQLNEAESVKSYTPPVDQSTPNLQSSQFLSPSLSPKVPYSASVTSGSSRGSTPGPDNDMAGAVDVIVTHINSPTEFYIQYKSELPSLNVFYNELGGSSLQNISDLQINLVCVVVRDKDKYRRCQVESIEGQSYAFVQFIDYGNSEMVNVSSLYSLPSQFKDTPLFAHKCQLHGIAPMSSRTEKYQITPAKDWSQSAKTFFRSVCEDKTDIKMKVISKDGNILLVDIIIPSSTGGLSVARQLVVQGKAKRCQAQKPQLPLHELPPMEPLPLCSTHRVSMITASSPYDFYVQLSTDSNDIKLADISRKIKEVVSLPRGSSNFQVGSLVIAPYEEEYFRAKILSRVKGGFRVLFLDYGNIGVVSKKALYPLDDAILLNEPPVALHCRLVDVIWTNGYLSWPEEVCEFFHKTTTDLGKDLLMTIVPVSTPKEDSNIIPVALRDISMNLIGPVLIEMGKALYVSEWLKPAPPMLPSEGTSKPAVVSHVDTPTKFHVHLSSNLETLQRLESVLDDLPPPPLSYYPLPLDYCLAHYSSTHRFHRAFIEFVQGRKVGVFFIDYGDRKEIDVSDIRPMLGVSLTVPAMALPCSLDGFGVGIGEGVELSLSDSLEFMGIVIDQEVNVVFKKQLEIHGIPLLIVDIFVKRSPQDNPMDVLSLLPTLASKQVTMATKSPSRSSSISSISSGKSPTHKSKTKASYLKEVWPESPFEAVITSVTEKGYVYGQPVTNNELLQEVEAAIKESVSMYSPGTGPLSVAQSCIAQYKEDGNYYRGTILGLNRQKKVASVHFVDYGNTEEEVPYTEIIDHIAAPHVPMLVLKLINFGKKYPVCVLEKLIDRNVHVHKNQRPTHDTVSIMILDDNGTTEIDKFLSN